MLNQTWLAAPKDAVTGKESDWTLFKDSFPSLKLGKSVMPKAAREEFGAPHSNSTFDTRTLGRSGSLFGSSLAVLKRALILLD